MGGPVCVCEEFHKSLDCIDLVAEDMLVDVCLHSMTHDYKLLVSSFFRSTKAARRTNESV